MKYLQIVNAVIAALGVVLAVVLAVVCLQYALYQGVHPRLAQQMPFLLKITAACTALAVTGVLTFYAHRKAAFWRWPAQVALGLAVVIVVAVLMDLRG